MMTLVDLIADYTILHLTAQYRHDLAEFVDAYLEEQVSDTCKQCGKLLHFDCIVTFEQCSPREIRMEPFLPQHQFCPGHSTSAGTGDWERLTNEQKDAIDRERSDMRDYFIAITELFYKEHPELQLRWQFTIDAVLREEAAL